MNRIRRWRLTTAAALLVVATLALSGCVVTKTTFASEPQGDRRITVWSYVNDPVLVPALNAIWQREHPDVTVDQVFIDLNELGPKLVAAAGTGDGPDVIIGNPVVDYPLIQGGGAYADITDEFDHSDARAQYPDSGVWKTDDRVYALQWRFNNLGLWYNQALLDKYHLTPPTTVAEMEADMNTVYTQSGGKIRGLAMSADATVQSAWQMMTWLHGNGVDYCSINSPETAQSLQMLESWRDKGWTDRGASAQGMEDVFLEFLRGNYLFSEAGNWEVGTIAQTPPPFPVGTTAIPKGAAGSFTSFAGESVAVGKYSKDKALAWQYVQSVYLSPEGQTTTFLKSGALPPRLDTRESKDVQSVKLSQPFLAELAPDRLKPWPDNARTLDAQNDVGTAWSDLMAGNLTASQAADRMAQRVHDDFKEGGGGC